MRQNTKKFKPNPSKTSRHSIRSYSIRDIIGDRRFNHQFSHANPHGTEGIKKVKRTKVDDTEADDLPNMGRNSSSNQGGIAEDPRRCCGDFAAKTSEYAFFKKLKQTTSSNMHLHPKYHDNQVNNVQQSDHSSRKEVFNVQKESVKYASSSLPVEKEQDDARYSFLSPPFCGSKNSANGTNNLKVTPREYNRLSPPVKNSGNKGVFSVKREKLRCRVADIISLNEYDVNEVSSKGIDLVSALISRILPENQKNNCQDETNSKYKPPSFSEPLIKGHEAKKRKSILSYSDDDFLRSSSERRHLEWNHNGLESCFPPKSGFQYDDYHSEAYKRNWMESYLGDLDGIPIPRSLEWNPTSSKSSIWYNQSFRIPNLGIESGNLKEVEEFYFDNDSTVLEKPVPLLLGWEEKSERGDEFQREMNIFSSSQNDDDDDDDENQLYMMPVERHQKEDHFMASSSVIPLPCTPKHVMQVEDCSMKNHTWCLNEKQESFEFLLESPPSHAKELISFIHSSDEKENNFLCSNYSYSYMEGVDEIGYGYGYGYGYRYPLLLMGVDSSENETKLHI